MNYINSGETTHTFSIARPGFILPGRISDSIEQLSNPSYKPTTIDYLNLIVRYLVVFIGGSPATLITEELANRVFNILCNPDIRDISYGKIIQDTEYQLRMVGDIGGTIAIVKDIVERKVNPSGKYVGLDLGTGSGITLVAQYIQARRNGFKHGDIQNLGIEYNPYIIPIIQKAMEALDCGQVIQGDSTNQYLYHGLTGLTFVTNENIPYPKFPYSQVFKRSYRGKGVTYNREPFYDNFCALNNAGLDIYQPEIFPAVTQNVFLEKGHFWFSRGIYGKPLQTTNEVFYINNKIIQKISNPNFSNSLQIFTAPIGIEISGKMQNLGNVGNNYYMSNPKSNDREYQYTNDEVLNQNNPLARGRWNPTNLPGTHRKKIFTNN